MSAYCIGVGLLMFAMLGMAVFASFASFWPYNLSRACATTGFGLVDNEVGDAFVNSLKVAAGTRSIIGTALVFVSAYLLEKTKGSSRRCACWCGCSRCCRWPRARAGAGPGLSSSPSWFNPLWPVPRSRC